MRASPSFGPSTSGARPARRSPSDAGARRPSIRTSPHPSRGSARWASGARSPLAPTDPRLGTTGSTPALRRASSASTTCARTPEYPRDRVFARSRSIPRTASSSSGSPSPEAWLRMSRRWSWESRSPAIRTLARSPNPVLTPYTASPASRARCTTPRPAMTLARACSASVQDTPRRATASICSRPSDSPSRTMGAGTRSGSWRRRHGSARRRWLRDASPGITGDSPGWTFAGGIAPQARPRRPGACLAGPERSFVAPAERRHHSSRGDA